MTSNNHNLITLNKLENPNFNLPNHPNKVSITIKGKFITIYITPRKVKFRSDIPEFREQKLLTHKSNHQKKAICKRRLITAVIISIGILSALMIFV